MRETGVAWHCPLKVISRQDGFVRKAEFTLAIRTLANKRQLRGNKSKFIQTAQVSLAIRVNILSLIFL